MKKMIFIAEDDSFLIKFMTKRLEEEGYDIDSATDGKEAMQKLKEGEYHLIILDLIMPGLDGFELLSALKDMGNETPVLVYSNLSQDQDREEVLRLGAKEFLDKTNSLDALVALVKKYVK